MASIGEPWCATSDPTIGKHFGASSGGPETGFAEVSAGAAFDGTALLPKPTVKWKMGCFEITNTRRGL